MRMSRTAQQFVQGGRGLRVVHEAPTSQRFPKANSKRRHQDDAVPIRRCIPVNSSNSSVKRAMAKPLSTLRILSLMKPNMVQSGQDWVQSKMGTLGSNDDSCRDPARLSYALASTNTCEANRKKTTTRLFDENNMHHVGGLNEPVRDALVAGAVYDFVVNVGSGGSAAKAGSKTINRYKGSTKVIDLSAEDQDSDNNNSDLSDPKSGGQETVMGDLEGDTTYVIATLPNADNSEDNDDLQVDDFNKSEQCEYYMCVFQDSLRCEQMGEESMDSIWPWFLAFFKLKKKGATQKPNDKIPLKGLKPNRYLYPYQAYAAYWMLSFEARALVNSAIALFFN
ncbi:hypothetical protein VTN96DRAFT_3031 [Rasamsonia emersonii]